MPGRHTNLVNSRSMAYYVAVGAGGGCLDSLLLPANRFYCIQTMRSDRL